MSHLVQSQQVNMVFQKKIGGIQQTELKDGIQTAILTPLIFFQRRGYLLVYGYICS